MKIKLGKIVASNNALRSLSSKQLMAKTAYKISRNLRIISGEIELYQQQRDALVKKYGVPTDKPDVYSFENGNKEKFETELNALHDTEVENSISVISLSDLEDIKMSSGEMLDLDWLIKEDNTPDAPTTPS